MEPGQQKADKKAEKRTLPRRLCIFSLIPAPQNANSRFVWKMGPVPPSANGTKPPETCTGKGIHYSIGQLCSGMGSSSRHPENPKDFRTCRKASSHRDKAAESSA